MKFTKRFSQENQEKNEKRRTKRFSPIMSFLIVGTLVITAFFRGTVSHILLITLFIGCGLYSLIGYINRKSLYVRHAAVYTRRRNYTGKRYAGRNKYRSYNRNINHGRNAYSNNNRRNNNMYTRNKYRKVNVRRNGVYRNGQNKAV